MSPEGLSIAITGSARGIGRRMAEHFIQAGASVVLSDIDQQHLFDTVDELKGSSTGRVHGVAADVTEAEQCRHLVGEVVKRFGRIDAMICNAGVVHVKPFLDITPDEWDRTFDVNAKGTFLTIQAAARVMLEQEPLSGGRPSGKIINIASTAGRYTSSPTDRIMPHYRASKAAVISLTQAASLTLAPSVTVNAICPGLIDTDMGKLIDAEWSAIEGWEPGSGWKTRTSSVPLGRAQTVDDVVGVAEFLVSSSADYITGQAINVDGGRTLN